MKLNTAWFWLPGLLVLVLLSAGDAARWPIWMDENSCVAISQGKGCQPEQFLEGTVFRLEDHLLSRADMGEAPGRLDLRCNPYPPIYHQLLHQWGQLFGASPWRLRLLSLVFAILGILLWAKVLRQLSWSRAKTALFILLLALAPAERYFSSEIKALSLFQAQLALFMLAEQRRMAKPSRWGFLLPLGVLISAQYTHYFAIFVALAWFWHCWREERRLSTALISAVLFAMAFLPWLPVLFEQMHSVHRLRLGAGAWPWSATLQALAGAPVLGFLSRHHGWELLSWQLALGVASGWLLLAYGAKACKTGSPETRLALRIIALVLVALFIADLVLHAGFLVQARSVIFILPFLLLVIFAGAWPKPFPLPALALAAAFYFAVHVHLSSMPYKNQDLRTCADFCQPALKAGAALLAAGSYEGDWMPRYLLLALDSYLDLRQRPLLIANTPAQAKGGQFTHLLAISNSAMRGQLGLVIPALRGLHGTWLVCAEQDFAGIGLAQELVLQGSSARCSIR